MTLDTIIGTLRDGSRQLEPGTMLHVDELMKERQTNAELRTQWFYTADGQVYVMDGKNQKLAMTRGSSNPLLQDDTIDTYCDQLLQSQNYRPTREEVQRALEAPDTLLIDLSKLRLSGNEKEWRYLTIDTSKYNKLNNEERKFAERVYGQGDDFAASMKMLKDARIPETKIFVLNPDYVQQEAQESALGRASWLSNFNNNSNFNAYNRNVDFIAACVGYVGRSSPQAAP
ncbi:TPA: hypothetical protein HA234_06845 [Candidatus Woesearchaeota archaeon]|nr:hypothetical protein [Candidatus Woesearchaeota archaeon]